MATIKQFTALKNFCIIIEIISILCDFILSLSVQNLLPMNESNNPNKIGLLERVSNFFALLDKIPDGIRAAIIPTTLSVLGVVVLYIKGNGNNFWAGLCISLFGLFAFLKILVDYINFKSSRLIKNDYEQLRTCLSEINHVVEEKIAQLARIANSNQDALAKSKRARSTMKYKHTARTLCYGLKNTVITYLRNNKKLGNAEVSVSLLTPIADGTIIVVISRSLKRPDVSQSSYRTDFSINKSDTLAGWLWNNPDTYISYSNVKDAIRDGRFRYLTEGQENYLRSIFCCKVYDARTHTPHSVISIDSDKVGLLPNSGTAQADELAEIVGHFSTRLSLELVYDGLLDELGPFLEDAITAVDSTTV